MKLDGEVFELFSADSEHMDMYLGLNSLGISCLDHGLEAEAVTLPCRTLPSARSCAG